MKNSIKLKHDDFKSTKNGFLIVAIFVSILFLLANFWLGIISIIITIILFTLEVGIEIHFKNRKYRYYVAILGFVSGKWKGLDNYKAIIVLRKKLSGQLVSPKVVTDFNYKHVVFDVNLCSASHRVKFSLKKYRSIDDAMNLAKLLSEKLELPLEKYSPILSNQTKMRRKRR